MHTVAYRVVNFRKIEKPEILRGVAAAMPYRRSAQRDVPPHISGKVVEDGNQWRLQNPGF